MKRSRSSPKKAPAKAVNTNTNTKAKAKTAGVGATTTTTTASVPAVSTAVCRSALLVIGNYHAIMAGLVLKKEKFYLKFAIKHHVGNVNDIAVTDRYVASCGADERVFLFTNKAEQRVTSAQRVKLRAAGESLSVRLSDLGSLTPPSEVLCLEFTAGSQYLLLGCADGQLVVYRCRDWTISNSLEVHGKALISFAVHPASAGTLAVSVGADRSVAVLDLAKGRLLTKWKYTATPVIAGKDKGEGAAAVEEEEEDSSEEDEEDEDEEDDEEKETEKMKAEAAAKKAQESAHPPHSKRAKRDGAHVLQRLFALEEPVKVVFSPAGTHFLIQARFSFVLYSAAAMAAVGVFRLPQPPQPEHEMHTCTLLDETTVLVGNESAQLHYWRLGGNGGQLKPVVFRYPEPLRAEAAALLARPVDREAEVRRKNPLRHVSRLKGLHRVGGTLFTLDANAIVVTWGLEVGSGVDGPVALTYVTSANCQGRATSLDVLQL